MTLLDDLSVARRRLARSPGFAAVAVVTLALGIGAHTAIFGLVDRLFLRDLPVAEPDRLVGIYESRDGAGYFPLSLPDYRDYRARATVLSGLAAHYPTAPLTLELGDGLEEVNGSVVSPSYFDVLGLAPARGRFFRPEEGEAGAVAVVSHDFWRTRLGGREDALGTVLRINAVPFTVVGVAPKGFDGVVLGMPSEVWIPTAMAGVGYRWCDAAHRDCTWVKAIGRLAPGRTLEEARAEMEVLARQVRRAHQSGGERERGLAVAPFGGVEPAARPAMLRLAGLLLAAVTLVLLVAAANLGGLLVARGLTRRKELAVRLAIGAPRRRVVSLFVSETLLLSLAGGAGGLLVAAALGRIVARLYPSDAALDLTLTPTTLAYAAGLALATALAVGAVPGIQAARPSLVPALKDEAAGAAAPGRRRPTLLGLLVVAQVALSFVLLTGTGLLVRSLAAADRLGGVDPDTVATLRLRPRLVGPGRSGRRPSPGRWWTAWRRSPGSAPSPSAGCCRRGLGSSPALPVPRAAAPARSRRWWRWARGSRTSSASGSSPGAASTSGRPVSAARRWRWSTGVWRRPAGPAARPVTPSAGSSRPAAAPTRWWGWWGTSRTGAWARWRRRWPTSRTGRPRGWWMPASRSSPRATRRPSCRPSGRPSTPSTPRCP
jgi:predicted permease